MKATQERLAATQERLAARESEFRQCHRKIENYEGMIHQMRQQSSHVPRSQPPVHSTGQNIPVPQYFLPRPEAVSDNMAHSSAPVFVSNTGSSVHPPRHHSQQAPYPSPTDSMGSLPPPQYDEQQLRDMFQRHHHDREVAAQKQKMHEELQQREYHHRQEKRDIERRGYDEEAARALREAEELQKQAEAKKRLRPVPVPRPLQPGTGPPSSQVYASPQPISDQGYDTVSQPISDHGGAYVGGSTAGGVPPRGGNEMVSGTGQGQKHGADDTDPIPENPILEGIDQDIQYFAEDVYQRTRRPLTAEVDVDENPSLPYDPNLVCPKCGKRFHIGEIQKFKRHALETCPYKDPTDKYD